MLKTILIALALVFLSCGLMCGGIFYFSFSSGTKYQERFFTAISTGDPAQVEALLAPSLRAKIDEPVLAAWVDTINKRLGPFQKLSGSNFSTFSRLGPNGKEITTKGTVEFADGTANSRLVFVNDLVEEFTVTSPQLPDDWWAAAAESDFYRQRGEEFLTALLDGDTQKAFSLVDPALRQVTPLEKMADMAEKFVANEGRPQQIEYATRRIDAKAAHPLRIFYKIPGKEGQTYGSVSFVFKDLQAQIVDFELAVDAAEVKDTEAAPRAVPETAL
jgi:hypothetical protein